MFKITSTKLDYPNPIEMEHKRYKISTIHFRLKPGFSSDYIDTSRIRFQDIDISYSKKLVCKPEMLLKQLKFKIGDFYSKKNTEDSYRKLSNLGIFNRQCFSRVKTLF